jgi:hypothetical protein
MSPTPALLRSFCAAVLVFLPLAACATPPAAIPDPGDRRARSSFKHFANDWMGKMHRLETQNRARPALRPGAERPLVTFRGYGSDFTTELKPTGHPQAPYVGILRYTEHLYTCSDARAKRCSVASTTPVTEIFRFQDGRWIY